MNGKEKNENYWKHQECNDSVEETKSSNARSPNKHLECTAKIEGKGKKKSSAMIRNNARKVEAQVPLSGALSMNRMSTIDMMNRYKDSDGLFQDIDKLSSFGKCDPATGLFLFDICNHCKGPRLGHKDRAEACKSKIEKGEITEFNDEEVEILEGRIRNVHRDFFNMKLSMIDKRRSRTICDVCDFEGSHRYALECHMRDQHVEVKHEQNSASPGKIEVKIPGMEEILAKLANTANGDNR